MYCKNIKVVLTVVLSLLLVPTASSQASQNMPKLMVFGEQYRTLPANTSDKAQVVYYRAVSGAQKLSGANVYVDGHYHTSLLSGGFSTFCLLPGDHTLGHTRMMLHCIAEKLRSFIELNWKQGKLTISKSLRMVIQHRFLLRVLKLNKS